MAPKRKAPETAPKARKAPAAAAKPKAAKPKAAAKMPAAAAAARARATTKATTPTPKPAASKPKPKPPALKSTPKAPARKPAAAPKSKKPAAAAAKAKAKAVAPKTKTTAKKPAAAAAPKRAAAAPAKKPAAAAKKPTTPAAAALDCFTFGSNPFGALGLGEDVVEKFRPAHVPLPSTSSCVQVACGGMHTLALSADGRVFSWGVNDEGALGRPTAGSAWEGGGGGGKEGGGKKGDPYVPGEVKLPQQGAAASKVVAVAAGDGVSFALTARGDVYGWGCFKDDASGASGFSAAAKVQRLPALVYSASEGAVGGGEAAAGAGGKSNKAAAAAPPPAKKQRKGDAAAGASSSSSPSPKTNLGPVVKVACGARHVALLTRGGDVLTFGMAGQGQLGRVKPFDHAGSAPPLAALLTPAPVALPASLLAASKTDPVVDVSCGLYATYAVTKQGRVAAWGLNNAGQLALPPPAASAQGAEQFVWLPKAVAAFGPGTKAGPVAAIAGGEHHALALTKAGGKVLAFGSPTYGMLGRSDVDAGAGGAAKHPEPKEVDGAADGLAGEPGGAVAMAAGTNVSACVTASGNLYLWGSNVSGQMAKGADDDDCERPARMRRAKTFGQRRVVGVAFGGQHAALLAGPEDDGGEDGAPGVLSPA